MDESQSLFVFFVLATIAVLVLTRFYPRAERLAVLSSWLAHVAGALGQATIYLHYYGFGDLISYSRKGMELAAILRQSFFSIFPEVIKLILQMDAHLPVEVVGIGTSTGTMSGLTTLVCYFIGGGVFTCCLVFAFFAFLGKVALYSVFREVFHSRLRPSIMLATLFVPSVVFWSCAPLKESVAIVGLGLLVKGIEQAMGRGRYLGLAWLFFGVLVIAFSKPYVLFAGALGGAAWFYVRRLVREGKSGSVLSRPFSLITATILAVGIVVILGSLFERFSLERLAESAAMQQEASSRVEGGSNYEMGSPEAGTWSGQIALAPLALVAAWFRPFLFEAKNALMAVNALETSWVSWLFARAVLRRRDRNTLTENPWLAFCLVFAVVLGVGVGLGTTNLGTLSRYRVPFQSFWVLILLVTSSQLDDVRAEVEPAVTA